jgi:hypothetical protein
MPITAEDRSKMDAESYETELHLITELSHHGATLLEEAAILKGVYRSSGRLDMTFVRQPALNATAAFAAYDAAIAAGKTRITHGEWKQLIKAALPPGIKSD